MLRRCVVLWMVWAALTISLTMSGARAQTTAPIIPITVFAAASLTNALQAACDLFQARSGAKVRLSFAASSTLAKQIEAGAGAQLFVSADDGWMDYLERHGSLAAGTRRPLLSNTLVLVVPADKPLTLEIGADRGWIDRLPAGRIATGDPAHVPVGRYAQAALTRLGVWGEIAPRLARADDVRNALMLVERGEAAAGIVYGTDARIAKSVKIAATFPAGSHDPIHYPIAITRNHDTPLVRDLSAFLSGPQASEVFGAHGFTPLTREP